MSVREFSRRIFQSLWRGVYREQPKRSGEGRSYRTLEVKEAERLSGGNKASSSSGRRAEIEWRPDRQGPGQRRRASINLEIKPDGSRYTALISARKALIGSVIRRVTNTQAANLRRKAARYLTGDGNPASFLALLGVSLASGTGIMTKEDEIEGVCQEIRHAVSKTSLLRSAKEDNQDDAKEWSLADFELGQPLAKGCSAVVYSARSVDSKSDDYKLAIKMMFNYHAESNALTILRAMQREIVAARSVSLPHDLKQASRQLLGAGHMVKVPPHPNIVEIYTAFADRVPGLPGAEAMYGDALPMRLNPQGCGRNMSLFLVMRRYDCCLREYLDKFEEEINTRISVVLFTQLLEGVAFLHRTGVSHRDLKSDNILIDLAGGVKFPRLVITDFGCCLADSRLGLRLPYRTYDTDKGGNPALMAPEVATAVPGTFTTINYSKADLWTAGTIGYEIFGGKNPFYHTTTEDGRTTAGLFSTDYTVDDLPALPVNTPPLLSRLVKSILHTRPEHRPSPKQAATICQLFLWSPSLWIKESSRVSSQDILQWLLTMTTKVLCESRWGNTESALQEYQLVATFLTTTSLYDIKTSLSWIQDQLDEEQ